MNNQNDYESIMDTPKNKIIFAFIMATASLNFIVSLFIGNQSNAFINAYGMPLYLLNIFAGSLFLISMTVMTIDLIQKESDKYYKSLFAICIPFGILSLVFMSISLILNSYFSIYSYDYFRIFHLGVGIAAFALLIVRLPKLIGSIFNKKATIK